jgi:DNA-binding NarL/FixJ family response regulator
MIVDRTPHHEFAGTARREARAPALTGLTPMQMKVLEGVHSGLLNKQIAFDLGIAETTVKAHMTALMRKLNVRNRTQVAIVAEAMGWDRRGLA